MRRQMTAAVAAASIVVMGVVPAVAAAAPTAGGGQASEHARILAYWTPERMKAAQWRDFVFDPASGSFRPNAKPGGGGTTSGAVTGASWLNGGQIVKTSGRVYFEMGGSGWICSGAVVNDNNTAGRSIVLTAGHCAIDETTNTFATNWIFIPDFDEKPTYDCATTIYGCWTASALVVDSEFATAGGFNDQAVGHDWAFAVVGAGGKANGQLDATVGNFGIDFTQPSMNSETLYAFGYPAAGKYHGLDLTYCSGKVAMDTSTGTTMGMACDMTGGSSGGPWLSGFTATTGVGTLRSLNSYGYSGVKKMFGPIFTTETQDAFSWAKTVTANKRV